MKKTLVRNPLAVLVAAGLASAAHAQAPFVVNLSGATLLQNQLIAPALTNDFIDVDGDGFFGSANVDQLAPGSSISASSAPANRAAGIGAPWMIVTYRATGSVNGVQELVDFGSPNAYAGVGQNDAAYNPAGIRYYVSTRSVANRAEFINSSNATLCTSTVFNGQNPGAIPVRSTTPAIGAPEATWNLPSGCTVGTNPFPGNPPVGNGLGTNVVGGGQGLAAAGGTRIDIAPVDVPILWAVRTGTFAQASPTDLPGNPGYGTNTRVSVGRDGTSATIGAGIDNLLASLGARNLFDPANPSNQSNLTVFETSIAFAPIAAMVNLGVGESQMTQSELRHLFATGRRLNGENLVAVTRDSGSGTRNGFNNTTGLDPSFGVGDNVGGNASGGSNSASEDALGASFVPGNKAGSGNLERTVVNHRLAVGYSGAERAVTGSAPASWGIQGRAELLAIKHDLTVGPSANFVRPTITNVLDATSTNPNSYAVGGPAIFAHIGDPRNSNEIGGTPGNNNTRMSNPQAAAFLNNITRSIEAFTAVPGGSATNFMPGELIAQQQVLPNGLDAVHSKTNPVVLLTNDGTNGTPGLNQNLQTSTAGINTLANAFYSNAFGSVTLNGVVPNRVAGTYTDGNTGLFYVTPAGNLAYGAALPARNRIAGDFNGDGLRNLNDAVEMMKAYWSRNGGPTWNAPAGTGAIAGAPGNTASIEILGDFNGDGNFTIADIRYWADGLAIDPATGKLDRKKGFEAVDNAWFSLTGNNNFFGTTVTGPSGVVAYTVGASRFDVSGAAGIARGWAPVGANNAVDATDRAYIAAQIAAAGGGTADWSNISQAVAFDLSADVTGDLLVNQADLDAFDALFGSAPCYANCDLSTTPPVLNAGDFTCFLNRFRAAGSLSPSAQIADYANCDQSTTPPVLNAGDFTCFLTKFRAGCI